jgi:hypothetical protein
MTSFLDRDTTRVMKRTINAAYPRVISNLGALLDKDDTKVAVTMIRFMNHYARNIRERQSIIDFFKKDEYVGPAFFVGTRRTARNPAANAAAFADRDGKLGTSRFMNIMSDHFTVGFANTLGYAHANSGDTMTSVMIGGLRTVINGDFEIFAGDLVQFYWTFEKDDFEQDGHRKEYLDIWEGSTPRNLDPSFNLKATRKRDVNGNPVWSSWQTPEDAQIRQAHYDLSYGQRRDRQKIVAKIKPFFRDDKNPRLMDWFRVFGVAIASARPNEMCDIKIGRQSM